MAPKTKPVAKATKSKTSSTFESVFASINTEAVEYITCKVRFIKLFTHKEMRRAMLVVEHDGVTKKVYCFPDTIGELKAPFKADMLVELNDEGYWNVTAISEV